MIGFLTVTLLVLFVIEADYNYKATDWKLKVLKAVIGVMAVVYGLIIVMFIPLFVGFILLLKRHFETIYTGIRIRLFIAFMVFMIVMGARFVTYCLIEFSRVSWLGVETIRGEIPLYISEIFISLCYLKILTTQYNR